MGFTSAIRHGEAQKHFAGAPSGSDSMVQWSRPFRVSWTPWPTVARPYCGSLPSRGLRSSRASRVSSTPPPNRIARRQPTPSYWSHESHSSYRSHRRSNRTYKTNTTDRTYSTHVPVPFVAHGRRLQGFRFSFSSRLFSAMRALTSFRTRVAGMGLSTVNRIVPLLTSKPLRSFLCSAMVARLIG
jgi:hypothetical protein